MERYTDELRLQWRIAEDILRIQLDNSRRRERTLLVDVLLPRLVCYGNMAPGRRPSDELSVHGLLPIYPIQS